MFWGVWLNGQLISYVITKNELIFLHLIFSIVVYLKLSDWTIWCKIKKNCLCLNCSQLQTLTKFWKLTLHNVVWLTDWVVVQSIFQIKWSSVYMSSNPVMKVQTECSRVKRTWTLSFFNFMKVLWFSQLTALNTSHYIRMCSHWVFMSFPPIKPFINDCKQA